MNIQLGTICVCVGTDAQIEAAFYDWRARGVFADSELLSLHDVTQRITDDANTLLHAADEVETLLLHIVRARARLNRVTIVHAPRLTHALRKIAKQQHVPIIALAFDDVPVREHIDALYTYEPSMPIERLSSPFTLPLGAGLDVLGDIHGCFDEMITLIEQLGYVKQQDLYYHPQGRKLVSLGDVSSRGPKSIDTLLFWQRHIEAGLAYMTDSNHGYKIGRWLAGNNVTLAHGDELVAVEFAAYEQQHGCAQTAALKQQLADVLLAAPSHYVVTNNDETVAVLTHAGIKDHYIHKQSARIRDFCRYGDVGGIDANGKPVRKDWFATHAIDVPIIWGHVPHVEPTILHNTMNIDQGCVFGGQLTAIRLPSQTFVTVPAAHHYAGNEDNPIVEKKQQRFEPVDPNAFQHGFSVHVADENVTIRKDAALTALDMPQPRLTALPMLVQPPKASQHDDFLQHPDDVFAFYNKRGVSKVVMQQHVNGHRALIFVAKTADVTKQFIGTYALGSITAVHGDALFDDATLEQAVLARLHEALQPYFTKHATNYVLFEAVITPMNIRNEAALTQHMTHASEALAARRIAVSQASETERTSHVERLRNAARFEATLHNYRWPLSDATIQVAPLQLLAHSSRTFTAQNFSFHAAFMDELVALHPMFIASPYDVMDTPAQQHEAVAWWHELSELGHTGAIIKPFHRSTRKLPAFIVHGREYLRLLYGIDYTLDLAHCKHTYRSTFIKHAATQQVLFDEWVMRFVRYDRATALYPYALASLALHDQKEKHE